MALIFKNEDHLPKGLKNEFVIIEGPTGEIDKFIYIIDDNHKIPLMTEDSEINIEIPTVVDDTTSSINTTFSSSAISKLFKNFENKINLIFTRLKQIPEQNIDNEKIITSIINNEEVIRYINILYINKEYIINKGNYKVSGYIIGKNKTDVNIVNYNKNEKIHNTYKINGFWFNNKTKNIFLINDNISLTGKAKDRIIKLQCEDCLQCNLSLMLI
jgi:hypothetical protein